ncbi:hypothetical protein Tco_0587783, partial [Tanacetum coccineum]
MVDLVNQRKKHFAKERAKAKRNKPMTQSQMRIYMSNYLKNQGTWKFSQLKKLKFEEIKEEFEKIDDKDVSDTEEKVGKVKEEEPVKRVEKRKKQKARKELATPEQTATGKEYSNPLIADDLLKIIWEYVEHDDVAVVVAMILKSSIFYDEQACQ